MAGIEGDFWKMKADRSKDPKREPGPIHLQRYAGTMANSGIATFLGLPVCLTQGRPEGRKGGRSHFGSAGRYVRGPAWRRFWPAIHPLR